MESLPSDIHQHTPVPTEAEDDVVALETPPNFSDDDEELQGIVWNNSTARCQCTPVPPNTPTPSKRSWSRSGETGDTATMRMAHSSSKSHMIDSSGLLGGRLGIRHPYM